LKFKSLEHLFLSYVIPSGLLVLTSAFKELSKRDYRRFLDSVIYKAKIESLLELDNQKLNYESKYWSGEPLIPIRHLKYTSLI